MRIIFTFDCYGTLIDWLGGVEKTLRRLYKDISDKEIKKVIRFWGKKDIELVGQRYVPYREILRLGFKYALERTELTYNEEILNLLVNSIKEWEPFPDTKNNLEKLKRIGAIGIISNTDREFIQASIKNIGVEFDYVIVAEDIKVYKPDPDVFIKAKIKMAIKDDLWIHISSYPEYDIIPAKKVGIYTILLNRYGYRYEANQADKIFDNFDEMVNYLTKKIPKIYK